MKEKKNKIKKDLLNGVICKESDRQTAGITLIALVITIVVLIILAAVAINLTLGNNGIFNRARTAKEQYANAQAEEFQTINDAYGKLQIATDGTVTMNLNDLKSLILENQNPVGTVIAYYKSTAPEGYLACDGSEYDVSVYPKLAEFFGATGTKFNVPDLRGEFLRGTGTNSTTGFSGANVGAHQEGTQIPEIWKGNGTLQITGQDGSTINSQLDAKNGNLGPYSTYDVYNRDRTTGGHSGQGYVRPTNTSVLYCIKY